MKELLDELREQAQELIDGGDSHEKREGYGMMVVLDALKIPLDEEESGAPQNFSDVEVEEWKQNWGQSHGEITSELGFPRSHAEADELILNTGNYFWDEKDKKWYNRYASLFTDRERAIADYLYYINQNE